MIALQHEVDLFSAFWSVLLLGAVPTVFAYPPEEDGYPGYVWQLQAFATHAGSQVVLTLASLIGQDAPAQHAVVPRYFASDAWRDYSAKDAGEESLDVWQDTGSEPSQVADAEQPAILQFSSGTTGAKKGVIISHRALSSYLSENAQTMQLTPQDVTVSWLTLHHNMGLFACFIVPLVAAFSAGHHVTTPMDLPSGIAVKSCTPISGDHHTDAEFRIQLLCASGS